MANESERVPNVPKIFLWPIVAQLERSRSFESESKVVFSAKNDRYTAFGGFRVLTTAYLPCVVDFHGLKTLLYSMCHFYVVICCVYNAHCCSCDRLLLSVLLTLF